MKPTESAYRREGSEVLIELQLRNLAQFYNTLDPAPFHEKDLDADAEAFIVDTACDIPARDPVRLVIYLPPDEAEHSPTADVAKGIHHYFLFKAHEEARRLRRTMRHGRLALLVGLTFLAASTTAEELLGRWLADGLWLKVVREGLLIGGWVAMWKPIEIFLYSWWPQRHMIRIYRKLSRIAVELRESP